MKMCKSKFDLIKEAKKEKFSLNKVAKGYDAQLYSDEFFILNKNKVEYYYVKKYVTGNILDAGTGTGRFSLPLIDDGYRVFSCDISHPMLIVAKSKNSKFNGILTDIFNLPFRNSSFDSIISITVLEHFPNYNKIIGEFSQVVKPNGNIIFEMPNKRNRNFLKKKYSTYEKNAKNVHFCAFVEKQNIIDIFNKYNVKLLHYFSYDYFNRNQILRTFLFQSLFLYSLVFKLLNIIFKIPGLLQIYSFIEIYLLRYLPDLFTFNSMIIAKKNS